MIESLRDRLLKRFPPELRPQVRLVRDVGGLYPLLQRAAHLGGEAPAIILASSGFVYYPPPGGAIVRWLLVTPDTGGSEWRFQLGTTEDIAFSSQAGGQRVNNVYAEAPIRGVVESFQFAAGAFPSGQAGIGQGTIAYPNLVVRPPNILMAALSVANLIGEWNCYVEEYVSGEEAA